MLFNLSLNRLASVASVAALTIGVSFVASPAEKASAQVTGVGSTAAAGLYTGFGANYLGGGSGVCAGGTIPDGANFCATDIPVEAQEGIALRSVANLSIDAPVNGGDTGLSQEQFCAIIRGEVTTFSDGTPITVVFRADNSGTRFIINNACGADGSNVPGAIGVTSTGAVISTVASTSGALGYAETANLGGVTSALASPLPGTTYALVRIEDAETNAFIQSILDNPGQVSALGYFPL